METGFPRGLGLQESRRTGVADAPARRMAERERAAEILNMMEIARRGSSMYLMWIVDSRDRETGSVLEPFIWFSSADIPPDQAQ